MNEQVQQEPTDRARRLDTAKTGSGPMRNHFRPSVGSVRLGQFAPSSPAVWIIAAEGALTSSWRTTKSAAWLAIPLSL